MATAPQHIVGGSGITAAYTEARREVRRTQAQARKANRALARLEEELTSLGISLTITDEGDRDE